VPRAGPTRHDAVRATASLTGETGYPAATTGLPAERSASAPPPLDMHRYRRQRNHATCVMAFHADRREARVDSTTGPYRRIPKRLGSGSPSRAPVAA
jgi:hypothetical protein